MHEHYAGLKADGLHTDPTLWDTAFRDQTGQNINVAANGIAKLLQLIANQDE